MRRLSLNSFLFTSFLYLCTIVIIDAADPCFDTQEDGLVGNCIPSSSCTNNVTIPDLCPSYSSDYVCCFSDTFPGRETRGAWVATVENIDWPDSPSDSVAVQKTSLEFLVDQLEKAGINTIYFQVRPAGDALYISDIEPWSIYLTGSQGVAPNPLWDPFEYIIDYAHAKSIEIHAWINPYRAAMSPSSDGLAPNHMAKQFPQFAYPYDTFLWMDPGAEVVQNRTYEVVIDLVTRYDLDGIHMDDYYYPYPVAGVPFPDDQTFADYLENGGTILGRDDWRRDNVNKLIKRMYDGVHAIKPFVKMSVSPFGIYRACHKEGMPCSIQGFDAYSEIYCDAKLWLVEGWVDVLQPQLYWLIDPAPQSYPVLLDWWVSQNPLGRHVYAGNYLGRIESAGWPLSELTNQIAISRQPENRMRGSWGNIQFSAKTLKNDFHGSIQHFRDTVYQLPALSPPFPWLVPKELDSQKEGPSFQKSENGIRLTSTDSGLHKIAIYEKNRVTGSSWNIHKIIPHSSWRKLSEGEIKLENPGHYAASTLDRYGQESNKFYFQLP